MTRLASILAVLGTLLMSLAPLFAGTATAAEPGNQHFNRTWQRTDLPVADLLVSRTWMWGPQGNTGLMVEPYSEAPGGERTVQYFDKSRMEITHPDGDPSSIWYVTNGLLVVELITGQMQVGDNLFEPRQPAEVPVAGDGDDPESPTYATFGDLLLADAKPVGEVYTERLSKSGQIALDPSLAARDVRAGHFDEVTRHTIAQPFWDFMNSSGTVYENGQFVDALMFESPLFATGRPVAEAYWAEVLIAGTPTDVLMQCFERRCLTYNPANAVGWQVEAGNVGSHYYDWRYNTPQDPGNGNEPPADPGPGDPPPGDPPPGDPPPSDPPPGDPPPGDPPPGNPTPDSPVAPANLTATPSSVSQLAGSANYIPVISLTWDDRSQDEDGFDIFAWEPGRQASRIGSVPASAEEYIWDGGAAGTEVCFAILATLGAATSEPSNSVCTTFPGQPALVAPSPGLVAVSRIVNFEWEPVDGALEYIVCLHFAGYEDAPCDGGSVLSVSGDHASAGGDTAYRWNVHHSLAASGTRTDFIWSVVACFPQLDDPSQPGYCEPGSQWRPLVLDLTGQLAAPALVSPADGYTTTSRDVVFEFDRAAGAYGYVLCIFTYEHRGEHCDFNTVSQLNAMGTWTSDEFTDESLEVEIRPDMVPDGQFRDLYWTIAACVTDAYDCPAQGAYRRLGVDLRVTGLAAPTLTRPDDGYTASGAAVDLEWIGVEGAASYRVCWAEDASHSCPNNPTYGSAYLGSDTRSFRIYIQAGEQRQLEWTVGACDANGDCVWQTQTRTLYIDRPLGAPNLVSANVDQQRPSRYSFFWGAVPGAAYYVVCVAEPGANCISETGKFVKFETHDGSTTTLTGDIPRWLAPDNQNTHLNWTVAACTADDRCFWQYGDQPIYVDRVPNPALTAPTLGSTSQPNADPSYFTFNWNLVNGAERYILCVYEAGASCAAETGDYAKSSILGPTVDAMSMSIPLWLAPDGHLTTLRWSVGACDALLRCTWQATYGTIQVDKR